MKVVRLYVGSFFTSLDMQGASVSLLPVDSERLTRLDSPTQACHTDMLSHILIASDAWLQSCIKPSLPALLISPSLSLCSAVDSTKTAAMTDFYQAYHSFGLVSSNH